jgi:hypothetical protein
VTEQSNAERENLVREQGKVKKVYRLSHPGYKIYPGNRAWTAVRRDRVRNAKWKVERRIDCEKIRAGDFNAHSPLCNVRCQERRDAGFLEGLIMTHDLVAWNDEQATFHRESCGIHSIIDLTITTPDLPLAEWALKDDADATCWKRSGRVETVGLDFLVL